MRTVSRGLLGYCMLVAGSLGVLGCHHDPEPEVAQPTGPAPEWMQRAVVEQVTPLGQYQLLGDIFRGFTPKEDKSARWQVKLDLGQCYAFSGVGSETVRQLKIYVFNPVGQRMFSKEGQNRVLAPFCVTGQVFVGGGSAFGGPTFGQAMPGIYDIELKTTEGYGHIELGVFVSSEPAPGTAPTTPGAPAPASEPGAPPTPTQAGLDSAPTG